MKRVASACSLTRNSPRGCVDRNSRARSMMARRRMRCMNVSHERADIDWTQMHGPAVIKHSLDEWLLRFGMYVEEQPLGRNQW